MDEQSRCAFCDRAVGERESPGHAYIRDGLRNEVSAVPPEEASKLRAALDFQDRWAKEGVPVEMLVAGPGIYICDQCVEGCIEYIRLKRAGKVK